MAGEIIYADLDVGPAKRCREQHSLPQPDRSGCPQRYRTALWASCLGNLLLGVAVLAMGLWLSVFHQQLGNSGSHRNVSGNVGDGNTTLEKGCLELRKSLCLSQLQEGEGCKLCPTGWMLHGSKCYWVTDMIKSWSKSQDDCRNRGAELVMPGDQEELAFLNKILQKPKRYFWIGLSIPSAGKGWTWLNGSRLDQSRFPLSPWDEGRRCGVLRGDRIISENCSSGLQGICQKEATQL
ncbi:killer cell lectin-like receptor subfamily B member 1A [Grus americana]|uniref:killer cell lectin-like receptor subfamily B member 1A n=1 Tax=Grus americana TaxID=9117 RepID=UPI0024085BC3|nr:killer cell lectin-like receptor subfamily B member 1A [Grus americana]XP_054663359.1 killer cell lectin-like receptor subfamily B member 1A [Grus americana]XP_054667374.1 killer cell lectin-like receptor subfamily B member 1A [Grus americana]XP_054667900.1 killer cell lectin-like receptor subfamily B member 1A [Grus americana]